LKIQMQQSGGLLLAAGLDGGNTLVVAHARATTQTNLAGTSKKKSRVSGFLYSSLFSFHSSLFSNSPERLFQRKDKREERKEKVAFRFGEKRFLF